MLLDGIMADPESIDQIIFKEEVVFVDEVFQLGLHEEEVISVSEGEHFAHLSLGGETVVVNGEGLFVHSVL